MAVLGAVRLTQAYAVVSGEPVLKRDSSAYAQYQEDDVERQRWRRSIRSLPASSRQVERVRAGTSIR